MSAYFAESVITVSHTKMNSAFGFIDKNVVRMVDIVMLIGQTVARIIPDKFEIALKLSAPMMPALVAVIS